MINHMRGGLSQGEALDMALRESELMWTSGRTGAAAKRDRSPETGSRDDDRSSRNSGKSAGKAPKRKYSTANKGNIKYCISWNRGKCTQKESSCPQHHIHQCNVVLPNGKTCASTKHRSVNHE